MALIGVVGVVSFIGSTPASQQTTTLASNVELVGFESSLSLQASDDATLKA
jgi:hypothetical protein